MSPVTLVDYDPDWPDQYREIAEELGATFDDVPVFVEHIGSTAVPGLCAKPVIDILLGVTHLSDVEACIGALDGLGYRYRPEYEAAIPGRRYFVRAAGVHPRVHLHCVEHGAHIWTQHISFRDALRASPVLLREYAALKVRLASDPRLDKSAYTEAKAPFITSVLAGG